MSKKRFFWKCGDDGIFRRGEKLYTDDEVVDVLNEQQKEINELNQENADLLGDKIRSLDEFEKCTDKLKAKILELKEENEQLKKDLLESQGSYVRLVCFVRRLGLEGDDLARFEEEIGGIDE